MHKRLQRKPRAGAVCYKKGMKQICVFCGSSPGVDPRYREAAEQLGRTLAGRGLGLVYGGGSVGLMGVIANAVLAAGGRVTGVIPEALATKELMHLGLTELHVVANMHARKALMAKLADGFIAMPGGFGTLEELFEVVTWAQLGLHHKPIGLLNVAGFYEGLMRFVDHTIDEGFVQLLFRGLLLMDEEPEALLTKLGDARPPIARKWLREGDA